MCTPVNCSGSQQTIIRNTLQGFAVAHFVRYKGLVGRGLVFANLQVRPTYGYRYLHIGLVKSHVQHAEHR
jgi:hypothetical protein